MIIRKISFNDAPKACQLLEELTGTPFSLKDMVNRMEMIRNSSIDELFVCEVEKEPVGLLGFRIRESVEEVSRYGEVSLVVINSSNRQAGIGRFMMDYAEKLAKEKGCKGTWLVSGFQREEEAHLFYKKLGYEITGYRFVKFFN